jgi:hypothetical protein
LTPAGGEAGGEIIATGASERFGADFRAAAEAAVRRWVFTPARIDTVKDGVDLDGDGKPDYTALAATRHIRVFFDVSFDFRIEGGHGHVVLAQPDEPAPALT